MGNKLNTWCVSTNYHLYLTTPDNLAIFYRDNNVEGKFIRENFRNTKNVKWYTTPKTPLLSQQIGSGSFYSQEWGIIVVDEAQKYTNIYTQKCRALCSLYSKNRWVLSGTMFDEPKPERILGYYMLINDNTIKHNIPAVRNLIYIDKYSNSYKYHKYNTNFTGLKNTLVYRDRNPEFIPPQVNYEVVSHDLSKEESKIYTCIKKFLSDTNRRAKRARLLNNTQEYKKLNGFLFAIIVYLRQILICPMIPITNIITDVYTGKPQAELSQELSNKLSNLELNYYFENPESIKSTRITKALDKIQKHNNECVVLFSCFKSTIDIIKQFISDRQIFIMDSKMSSSKRGKLIEKFKKSTNGILMLTYAIGAEGLNLQCASTVLLLDFWWNSAKTKQAIARVFRYGQTANLINIYMFISNTGIEKMLMEKQKAKQQIIQELYTGVSKTKIPSLSMHEIIKLIEKTDNTNLLNDIYKYQNYYSLYNPNIYNNTDDSVLTI